MMLSWEKKSTVSSLLPLLKRFHRCRFVGKEITYSLFYRPARLLWFLPSLRPSRLKFPLSSCGFPDHRSYSVYSHTHRRKTLQSPSAVSSRTPCPSHSILIFIWLPRSSQSSFFLLPPPRRRHARPLAISLFFALRRVLPQWLRFLGEDSSESLISSKCVKGIKRGMGGDCARKQIVCTGTEIAEFEWDWQGDGGWTVVHPEVSTL